MKSLIIALLASLTLAGCSKKESVEISAEEAVIPDAGEVSSELASGLNQVNASVENQQYEEAIQQLMALKQARMNYAEQKQYQMQAFQVQQMLLQKAQTDERARQAYQAFGRAMTGR